MQILDKKKIAKSFGSAAHTYDSVAHFQRWVGGRLIDNLPECHPKVVLDLGCGTGHFSEKIIKSYPNTCYMGLDLSEGMVSYAKQHQASGCTWLVGDADSMPFENNSIDIIFSSLAIQWCANLPRLMAEIKRVLKPNGYFIFSTLLNGSLYELKQAWSDIDDHQHVNDFFIKQAYVEATSEAGLTAECLYKETKVLRYEKLSELMRELKCLGAHNVAHDRPRALMGKKALATVIESYEQFRVAEGYLPASYEVLFGVLKKTES